MTSGAIVTGGTPGLTQLLVAGIGEMVHSRDARAILVAYGLGSCVALSAWDPVAGVGGLAHFMLPGGQVAGGGNAPVKTVQGGLATFLDAFVRLGGQLRRAQFKAAGGAAMLSLTSGGLEIGRRNAEAVLAGLDAQGLRLTAKDLGGTKRPHRSTRGGDRPTPREEPLHRQHPLARPAPARRRHLGASSRGQPRGQLPGQRRVPDHPGRQEGRPRRCRRSSLSMTRRSCASGQ